MSGRVISGIDFVGDQRTEVVADDLPVAVYDEFVVEGIAACDIETSGLDFKTEHIGTFQVYGTTVGAWIVRVNGQTPVRLARLLADERVCKVFHYAPFDLRFVLSQWGVRATNVKCTKIASKVVFPELSDDEHSLKELLQRVADIELSKQARLSDWTHDELTEDQIQYAAKDVLYLLPLINALEELAASKGLTGLLQGCYAHIPTRVELDVRGYGDVFAY
jgi:ribonuclease D